MKTATKRTARVASALSLVALSSTACMFQGPTPEEQTTTVQFNGAVTHRESPSFADCIPGGTKGEYDSGGSNYTYPGDQRNLDFRGRKDSDRKPIRIVSSDGIEMNVFGTLQYELNTECTDKDSPLVKFHQSIGRRFEASFDNGVNDIPAGWYTIQSKYVENPMERTLIDASKRQNAADLWRKPEAKGAVELAVNENLQKAANTDTPTDQEFFTGLRFAVTKIEPAGARGEALRETYAAAEQSAAEARGRETTALANKAAAVAEVATAQAQAEAQIAVAVAQRRAQEQRIAPFGSPEAYTRFLLAEKGISPNLTVGVAPTVTQEVPK